MRQFIDSSGTSWDLYEVSAETLAAGRPDYLPEAFRRGWLVFECGGERRRLAPYPGEWTTFSATALCNLLSMAEPVRKREPSARDVRVPTPNAEP